jgi:hypothetical protein
MRTGAANLPLHHGRAPKWLFKRMEKLAGAISVVIIEEYGVKELLKRLSDPFWFQAFGCVLGYDWHSSGVTTTVCGALKSGLKGTEQEYGLFIAGGKGATSRKTPFEIMDWASKVSLQKGPEDLVYASKITAKVDSSAIQDNYQLYHHNFFFTSDGDWTVVQQGMNDGNGYARRYHWMSDRVDRFVDDPQNSICDDNKYSHVLNLTSDKSNYTKQTITEFTKEKPEKILKEYKKMLERAPSRDQLRKINQGQKAFRFVEVKHKNEDLLERNSKIKTLNMPRREWVSAQDIKPENLYKVLTKTYDTQPESFEQILGMQGVGPKSIRALSLISEIAYGTESDWEDPVKYSFAHGGKDGYPFPVDRATYDRSIDILKKAIKKAKLEREEKRKADSALMKLID